MSLSHERTTWHLTPRGWERGSQTLDFGQREDRPIPSDRVLTITNDMDVGALGGRIDLSTSEDWRSSDAAAVKALLDRFGEPPKSV